jgi:cysteine synthase
VEIDLGKGSAAALLVAALSSGGTYMGTRTEAASQDRCVEIVAMRVEAAESQRQTDLERARDERAADNEASKQRLDALTATCVESMKTLRTLCRPTGP